MEQGEKNGETKKVIKTMKETTLFELPSSNWIYQTFEAIKKANKLKERNNKIIKLLGK